jgi:predicted dehydrogenase
MAVEACAPRGIHVHGREAAGRVATTHAERMAELPGARDVLVLTNYETSWYASVREAKRRVDDDGLGPGPPGRPSGTGTRARSRSAAPRVHSRGSATPNRTAAGARFDFGCYGANLDDLATWTGARPSRSPRSPRRSSPIMYPNVDDDATIVLDLPGRVGVVQASWAWTHDNKEMDVFTEGGSLHCRQVERVRRSAPRTRPRSPPTRIPARRRMTTSGRT